MSRQLVVREKTETAKIISKRLSEGVFILVLSLSLFVLLALFTYHHADPGWLGSSASVQKAIIMNAGGWVGAYAADLLLLLLGYVAYILPFVLTYITWQKVYQRHREEQETELASDGTIQIVGLILLMLGACGLASFEFSGSSQVLPYTAGGVVGKLFSEGLDIAFNPTGTVLLLLALCFVGLTLLTGLSWISVSERTGYLTLAFFTKVLRVFSSGARTFKAMLEKRKDSPLEGFASVVEEVKIDQKLYSPTKKNIPVRKDREPRVGIVEVMPPNVSTVPERSRPSANVSELVKRVRNIPKETNAEINRENHFETLPSLNLLDRPEKSSGKGYTAIQLETMAREVEQRLLDFGIEVQVVAVHPGPVITRFELQLAAGLKVVKISGLAKDLARSLSVLSVRVVEVIPGKPLIGLELPNQYREGVCAREIFGSEQYQQARSPISLALGVDISGYPVVVDLAKMPHLLVAGTTGSGKSVGLNSMLLSILFKSTPEQVRLILVDPKMLEFSVYDRIPHLLTPVVTDMKEAANALRWCVAEMERRYRLMSALGVRNLAAYNNRIKEAEMKGETIQDPLWKPSSGLGETAPALSSLPYIVVVIDELADMMMVVGKKVEQLIARIAQKARAAGIHLILATQRPSVDVLTGLIKSNIPTRISFQVSSKIDSRTILDQQGAEQLLGHGDMLYLAPGAGVPTRVHGAFVDDREVHRVADAWRERGDPQYVDIILQSAAEGGESESGYMGDEEDTDPLYDEAVRFVTETRKASISAVQRRLKVGYNRAARLIEEMERTGVVGPMEGNGSRDVIAPAPPED